MQMIEMVRLGFLILPENLIVETQSKEQHLLHSTQNQIEFADLYMQLNETVRLGHYLNGK